MMAVFMASLGGTDVRKGQGRSLFSDAVLIIILL